MRIDKDEAVENQLERRWDASSQLLGHRSRAEEGRAEIAAEQIAVVLEVPLMQWPI